MLNFFSINYLTKHSEKTFTLRHADSSLIFTFYAKDYNFINKSKKKLKQLKKYYNFLQTTNHIIALIAKRTKNLNKTAAIQKLATKLVKKT